MKRMRDLFQPKKITLDNGKEIQPPRSVAPFILIGLALALWGAATITGFDFNALMRRGNQFFIILKDMLSPDWSIIDQIIPPLVETIKMSILGSIIGSLLAFPVAILSSSNINKSKCSLWIMRFILSIVRTIPTLIIALFATYVFGLGTFAGTVAISIFTFGIVVKMLYEKIETIDMGPFEAMEAVGATKLEAFQSAITPQILPNYFSMCLYTLEINVRAATILGYVGAGGIGAPLIFAMNDFNWSKAGAILLGIIILVLIVETISTKLRTKLARG